MIRESSENTCIVLTRATLQKRRLASLLVTYEPAQITKKIMQSLLWVQCFNFVQFKKLQNCIFLQFDAKFNSLDRQSPF